MTSQPAYPTPFPGATVTTPQGGVTSGHNAFGYEHQLPTVTPQSAYPTPYLGGATVTPPQVAQYPVQPATTQAQFPNAAAVPDYTGPPPEPEYQEPTEFPGYPAPPIPQQPSEGYPNTTQPQYTAQPEYPVQPVYPNPQDPEYLAPASGEVEAPSPFPGLPQLPEQGDPIMREQEAMENFYREFGNIFPESES